MKPTTDLFDLIKRMTAQEKRYFKLTASLQSGDKKYISLFNLIDKQEKYDETILKSKLKSHDFESNIAQTKNYLYKLVIKSLIQFKSDSAIDSRLSNIYARSKLLYDKALFSQYFKSVSLGKKLAEEHERFGFLIEFIEIERMLTKKEDTVKGLKDRFYKEEHSVTKKILCINEYKKLISELINMYRETGIVRTDEMNKRVKKYIEIIELMNEKQLKSVTADERFLFAMYLALTLKGDFAGALKFAEKRKVLVEKNEKVFTNSVVDVSKEVHLDLITAHIRVGDLKIANDKLTKFRNISTRSGIDEINTDLAFYSLKVEEAHTGSIEEYRSLLNDLIEYLETMKGRVTIMTLNELTFGLAVLSFFRKDFVNTLKLIDKLLKGSNIKLTPLFESYSRMLLVLTHFELGNYKLLSFLIPSTVKLLKKKHKLFGAESLLLKHVKRMIRFKSSEDLIEQLTLFLTELENINKNQLEKNYSAFIDYESWIRSKIHELHVTVNVCLR
ncbi:MAG: hypothetical protein WBC65_02780 [Ignavibacteria bacterium]